MFPDCSSDGSADLKIDVLIGGDFYWKFITGDTRCRTCGPIAGCVLSGSCDRPSNMEATNIISSHKVGCISLIHTNADRDAQIILCKI